MLTEPFEIISNRGNENLQDVGEFGWPALLAEVSTVYHQSDDLLVRET